MKVIPRLVPTHVPRVILVLVLLCSLQASAKKPHIIMIVADDLVSMHHSIIYYPYIEIISSIRIFTLGARLPQNLWARRTGTIKPLEPRVLNDLYTDWIRKKSFVTKTCMCFFVAYFSDSRRIENQLICNVVAMLDNLAKMRNAWTRCQHGGLWSYNL